MRGPSLGIVLAFALIASVALGPAGCDFRLPFGELQWATPTLDVRDAELEGNFAALDVAEATPARATGFEGYGVEWVEVMVVEDAGTSMALIAFDDGLGAYPVGTRQTFGNSGADLAEITFLGCAGDEPFVWYADEDAVEVTLAVDGHPTDPELRRYTFDATFEDDSHLSGYFDAVP